MRFRVRAAAAGIVGITALHFDDFVDQGAHQRGQILPPARLRLQQGVVSFIQPVAMRQYRRLFRCSSQNGADFRLEFLDALRTQRIVASAGGGCRCTFGRIGEYIRIGGTFEYAVVSGHEFQLLGPWVDETCVVRFQ